MGEESALFSYFFLFFINITAPVINAAATNSITNGIMGVVSPVFTALLFFTTLSSVEPPSCVEDEEALLPSELSFMDTVLLFSESELWLSKETGVGVTASVLSVSSQDLPTACFLQFQMD